MEIKEYNFDIFFFMKPDDFTQNQDYQKSLKHDS